MSALLEINIYETLIDFLRANVSDPMSRGTEWIIASFPDASFNKPVITVMEVAQTYRRERSHGHQGTLEGYRYQIDIYTTRRYSVEISGTKYSGAHLLAYLSGQVKDALEQGARTYFDANLSNFLDLKMILSTTTPYNESTDEFRKTIGIIIEVERPKV